MKTFFAPGHVTGFFQTIEHSDPLKTGSRGAGIVLEDGCDTGVVVRDADENTVSVFIDGESCECETTKTVAAEILKSTCGAFEVEVYHFPKLPLEYGFGLSAAGAIGCALALNSELDLGLSYRRLGEIAHRAEIECGTGRGDVISEMSRGLVIRRGGGAPGHGRIKSVPAKGFVVSFLVGDVLSTKTVLEDKNRLAAVNESGGRCLSELLNSPRPERFMELSKRFTFESGLAEKEVIDAIKSLEKEGVTAAMNMLGRAVFTLTDEPETIQALLDYPTIVSKPLVKDLRSQDELG
ncbi:MAG TPA: kinase [Euryarchaeota archaeon]|nr:kinase [Euryarchaeota archaeon]